VTRHTLLWLLIILFILVMAPLVVSRETYEQTISSEMDDAARWYGESTARTILSRCNAIYAILMVSSGIDPFVRKYDKPPREDEISLQVDKIEGATDHKTKIRNYWGNLLRNVWMFCYRISHVWAWILWVFPFLIAIIYDGIMSRKMKVATFKYTSPTIYNLSWHLIIFLAAVTTILFAVATPTNIFVYPTILVAMGVNMRVLISNIQHSA